MSLKIIRADISKMETEAIVNTANKHVKVGYGCDTAVYKEAGYDQLLNYRAKYIGEKREGEVFITPGFGLKSKWIIHAISPRYRKDNPEVECMLRACYRDSLILAIEYQIKSVSIPLIATGTYGYPKEEGFLIAVEEIKAFLSANDMEVLLVIYDEEAKALSERLFPKLLAYVEEKYLEPDEGNDDTGDSSAGNPEKREEPRRRISNVSFPEGLAGEAIERLEQKLQERFSHLQGSFSDYLFYLIKEKKLDNIEVYTRALVDKKLFSKIKNNKDYRPLKRTALCLCIGARLNIDESRDLLARAGYAFSPSDISDMIFQYFIENEIYDMIELDVQLEQFTSNSLIA